MGSKRRWVRSTISLIVALALFIPFLSSTVSAAPVNSDDQIVGAGGVSYYDKDGKEVTASPVLGSNSVVSVGKTIRGTNVENEFFIDLEVKTSVDISNVEFSLDAAVVLVLDTSGSMAGANFTQLKTSAVNFVTNFADVKGTAKRYVSLVTFASNGTIQNTWIDVANNAANLKTITDKIQSNSLIADGGTFMQGGLLMARNLLRTDVLPIGTDNKLIDNRSVILFTDGLPTYYHSLNSQTVNYTTGTTLAFNSGNGSSTTQTEYDSVESMANVVKNNTSFTVAGTTYDKHTANLYTIGFGGGSPNDWLRDKVATNSTFHYPASNSSMLDNVFKAIYEQIESWADAWIVTDPMGANIVFDTTISSNDTATGLLDFTGNTLKWNLQKAATPALVGNVYTYNYSYKIKLDTTQSGFAANTDYVTNGDTLLDYVMVENGTTVGNVLQAKFPVPKVKGFKADFSFSKIGSDAVPLQGCVFQLDYANKTPLSTVTSDTNGIVNFTGVPSGHTYILTETALPASLQNLYNLNNDPYTVTVSMGNVVITDVSGNVVTGNFDFINQRKQIDFNFTKIDGIVFASDNKVITLSGAEFTVYKSIQPGFEKEYIPSDVINGTTPSSKWQYHSMATSDANGKVTLSLEPGDYMLVETKAPSHLGVDYTLPTGQWALNVGTTLSAPVAVSDDNGQLPPAFINGNDEYKLPNFRTQDLPLTGGSGIAIFIGVGTFLLVLGTVLFIVKQKRNSTRRLAA